jgi:MFS family permease
VGVEAVQDWVRRRAVLPRDVVILAIIAFCVAVGFGVLVPVLPVFARSFDVGNVMVGLVVSVFAFMRLITSPFCGRIADWMGERTTLAVGIFIVAASSAAAGLATTYWALLLMRGVGGIGSAMFTVSAMTLLLRSAPTEMRGRAAGFFQSGFLIGGMAGPAVGGALSTISLTAPFFFYAFTLAIAGTVGLALLSRGNRPADATATREVRPMRTVLADPRYQAACLANLSQGWNNMGVRNALIPILVVEMLLAEPAFTGFAFAIAAVVQTIALTPVGRYVDRVGRRSAVIGGSLLGAAVMAAVPFAPNEWALIALLCLGGIAAAALGTAPAAAVGDAAGARAGTPVAVFSMFADLGAIVGPVLAGLLADYVGMPAAFSVGAVLFVLAAVVAIRMPSGVPTPETARR